MTPICQCQRNTVMSVSFIYLQTDEDDLFPFLNDNILIKHVYIYIIDRITSTSLFTQIPLYKGPAIQAAMFGTGGPNAGDNTTQRASDLSRAYIAPRAVDLPSSGGEELRHPAAAAALRHHMRLGRRVSCRRQDHRPGDCVEAFG